MGHTQKILFQNIFDTSQTTALRGNSSFFDMRERQHLMWFQALFEARKLQQESNLLQTCITELNWAWFSTVSSAIDI